jgi:D-alanyl-D-alanine carboxypeptidase
MASPDALGWGPPCPRDRIVTFRAGGISLTAHEDAASLFAAFVTDIVGRGYAVDRVADDWGYNCRKIAGSDSWSYHAWGLAIDLNATQNPMGTKLVTDMPNWIDEVAATYGLYWGGLFNRRKDAMHFEVHLSHAEAKDLTGRLGELDDMDEKTYRRIVNEEVTKVLRLAVDPSDDVKKPASRWFDTVAKQLREVHAKVVGS